MSLQGLEIKLLQFLIYSHFPRFLVPRILVLQLKIIILWFLIVLDFLMVVCLILSHLEAHLNIYWGPLVGPGSRVENQWFGGFSPTFKQLLLPKMSSMYVGLVQWYSAPDFCIHHIINWQFQISLSTYNLRQRHCVVGPDISISSKHCAFLNSANEKTCNGM